MDVIDLLSLMAVIDADKHQSNEEFILEVNSRTKIKSLKKKSSFQYKFYDKFCLSSGGLQRHVTKKHPSSKAQEISSCDYLGSDLVPTLRDWDLVRESSDNWRYFDLSQLP